MSVKSCDLCRRQREEKEKDEGTEERRRKANKGSDHLSKGERRVSVHRRDPERRRPRVGAGWRMTTSVGGVAGGGKNI